MPVSASVSVPHGPVVNVFKDKLNLVYFSYKLPRRTLKSILFHVHCVPVAFAEPTK